MNVGHKNRGISIAAAAQHRNGGPLPCIYWDLVPRAPERETHASQPQPLLVALFADREV